MPTDPTTAQDVANAAIAGKVGGSGGALALGYAVFDWFKKSGTMKQVRADISKLAEGLQETKITLARLEERQITKADLQSMMNHVNERIDNLAAGK